MFVLRSDIRPDADTAYLSTGILIAALKNKFITLFGREPVRKNNTQSITDARVPDLIIDSLDSDIASLLKASAVEHSTTSTAELPEINNATLLYYITDDSVASVALTEVPEYNNLDPAAVDAVVRALTEQQDITVADGVAYVNKDKSTIVIGIFVDNQAFATEFQYRLQNTGGPQIAETDKVQVFDELFKELPGGNNTQEPAARDELLRAVGLTTAITDKTQVPDGLKAPGPQPSPTKP